MSILVERLSKSYDGHPVVNQVSLDVGDGELFVLLGPSGSGKSTVLRMIAGLTDCEGGRILLHGRDVTSLPPQKRAVGFVFQHYALFSHMTVAQNVEFPLRIRRVARAERSRRRNELLDLVGLVGFQNRYPPQLSGGQRQRVALARALSHKPDVLLLDEPFGALDAKIRAELRRTVRGIQRELKIVTIFVTHDQEEAFELADRVGIMNYGRLLEVGPPRELYLRPQTEFVATFLGTANLMVGESTSSGVRLGSVDFALGGVHQATGGIRRVQVLFRPEDVAVKNAADALDWPLLGKAVVEETSFVGSFEKLRLRLPPLAGVRPIAPPVPFGGDFIRVEATRAQHHSRRYPLRPGDVAWVGVRRVHALTHAGLSLLLVTDGSPAARAAVSLGGQIATRAHARVTLLAHETGGDGQAREHLQAAREEIGSGPASIETRHSTGPSDSAVAQETQREPYDLVVHALPEKGRVELAERLLEAGAHNLLLLPGRGEPQAPQPIPERVLVAVTVGEPGKEDVLFAARLVRHLGAEATILTVLPDDHTEPDMEIAQRFLAASRRSMMLMGIRTLTAVRRGDPLDQIQEELALGHQMLVLGTPLPGLDGRVRLDGLARSLILMVTQQSLLLSRSHHAEDRR